MGLTFRGASGVTMAAVLSGSIPGCSFLFVNPAPPPEQWSPIVRCTSSDVLPIVDVLVAGLSALRTVLVVSEDDAGSSDAAFARDLDITVARTRRPRQARRPRAS